MKRAFIYKRNIRFCPSNCAIGTFMYPRSGISPHPVHRAWAMAVCKNIIETPMGFGKFDINSIPESDFIIIESLFCAPFAKKYKKLHPNCKILSLVADTSFWSRKYSIARRIYYKLYLNSVDGFIAVSERIAKDAKKITGKPVAVVRPFLVNKHGKSKATFSKNLLFIGNDAKEKGFLKLAESMKKLPDFDDYFAGTCNRAMKHVKGSNIHVKGRVPSLENYFKKCSYYVHPADFDPSPVTVWEAMNAGLLPIITKDVGQSELFKGRMQILLLENNKPETIAKKIMELDNLPISKKKELSKLCKNLASRYTKEKSVKEFKEKFIELLKKL